MPATTFRIFRYQPDSSETESYHQDFQLEHGEKTTLLDAILRIQNEQDGTVAVRYCAAAPSAGRAPARQTARRCWPA